MDKVTIPAAVRAVALAVFLWLPGICEAAQATAGVSRADIQATVRSLGFVDSLVRDGIVVVGIVYGSGSAAAKASATTLGQEFQNTPGPSSATFRTEVLAADELAGFGGRLDALFIMPGASNDGAAIADFIRRRQLVTISNDPDCIVAKCCVLMIRTERGVEINLDTALADAVGARFSPVFAIMVKRR